MRMHWHGTSALSLASRDRIEVRIYGDAAVLLADGISAGLYKGQRFHEVERASNVFVRQDGMWRCVLTHLSTLPREA